MSPIEYYFTKPEKVLGEYDEYKVERRLKMQCHPSSETLTDNMDIFVSKSEFPTDLKPSEKDMAFFVDETKFYSVNSVEDSGNIWIINLNLFKIK